MWADHGVNYLFFVLEVFTIVFGIALAVILILSAASKGKGAKSGQLIIKSLAERYQKEQLSIAKEILSKKSFKKLIKLQHNEQKKTQKEKDTLKRLFVIHFSGDIKASEVKSLAKEVDSILAVAEKQDEVLLRLESPGGVVNGYGLAAAQLARIKEAGIHLVVSVDQVAASGGYMMASVADQIIASPFAIVGSIGVVAQLPNINRFLSDKGVDVELHTAGKYKRTLTMLGKNTEEGREKFQEELEVIHRLFKEHIAFYRPTLDIESVATGEYWYGKSALSLNLVDHLITGDAYLLDKYKTHDYQIFSVEYKVKKSKIASLYRSATQSLVRNGLS